MGGGASSNFRMRSGGLQSGPRPDWLAAPDKRIQPITGDKFQNLDAIGKGKFGFVYLSKHASGKCVAIKYISKQFVAENKSRARINQEIMVLQKLDHPFVVHCFGGFETKECISFVFDYCFGGELYTYMKKNGSLSEGHAKFYFCECAAAIDYLHNTLGFVYRDLKPENILIDCDGHVKLCDFGFAVPISKKDNGEDEPLHDGCGTAMYVAPEIAGGFFKRAHGFPVDWWGLGCVLAEMVTTHAPFGDTDDTNKFDIFNNITDKAPKLSMSMSGNLKTLIKGLLEKAPENRWEWTKVRSCEFTKDVEWDDLLARHITPPWIPKASKTPVSVNFVNWPDMVLPTAPTSEGTSYCNGVDIKGFQSKGCRTAKWAYGIEGDGGQGGSGGSRMNTPNQSPAGSRSSSPAMGGLPGSPGSPSGKNRKSGSFNKGIGGSTPSSPERDNVNQNQRESGLMSTPGSSGGPAGRKSLLKKQNSMKRGNSVKGKIDL